MAYQCSSCGREFPVWHPEFDQADGQDVVFCGAVGQPCQHQERAAERAANPQPLPVERGPYFPPPAWLAE